jgi:hypothetical protein
MWKYAQLLRDNDRATGKCGGYAEVTFERIACVRELIRVRTE